MSLSGMLPLGARTDITRTDTTAVLLDRLTFPV
jgi:hypothetical protein